MNKKSIIFGLDLTDLVIYFVSAGTILAAFLLFDRSGYLSLLASLLGVTSLIFCAKGNPIGQLLIIIFSILYAYISFGCRYYGEMLTYVGMTAPMALFSLISWLKHPFDGNRGEVTVAELKRRDIYQMVFLTALVTVIFYFVLRYLGTSNLTVSTVSVTTSFAAVFLTFKRSPYYAVAYGLNDIVLIILWTAASFNSREYISVTVCFITFLLNDIYGFISWRAIKSRQALVNFEQTH